ncbi:transcription factor bHLH94-like [Phalaenopsis equestris]|uniref:transcription factor bHLH94-like n=1 Tax=Phalaenopsis equestris TaxID=78828 RepID=UPI0009E29FF8|nr:transcription factor bHLH94-like [Phalaenopsis equestris]
MQKATNHITSSTLTVHINSPNPFLLLLLLLLLLSKPNFLSAFLQSNSSHLLSFRMALEAVVFPKEPFTYSPCKDLYSLSNGEQDRWNFEFEFPLQEESIWNVLSPPPELVVGADAFNEQNHTTAPVIVGGNSKKKRRRIKRCKNKEEAENQRMTHITVERNRRRQMNDYLAVLRSIMPASYVHKSDQASIIGGAISYVKELEYMLQTLEARKKIDHQFPFLCSKDSTKKVEQMAATKAAADIEVTMVESHANLKVLSKRQPRQLLKMVMGLQSLRLTTLHLNLTTINDLVLYSFSLKVEDDCQLASVDEVVKAVYQMMERIREETGF